MSDLHKALGDISSIRKQLANTTEFRGYGPATLAATGGFAVLAAVAQAYWVPDPEHHLPAYLAIWVATAVVCASLTGVQMYTRTRRMHSGLSDEMLRMPAVTWMLPGLWQVIFSIGIFSSCRFLPRAMSAAGVWYLATGLGCLSLAGSRALSPWTMGVAYGVGQLLIAGVLFLNAEGESDEV
jgi:fumarate reductase subunit D